MRKKYKVVWGDVAESDLVGIIDYIAQESPAAAKKVLKKASQDAKNLLMWDVENS